MRVPPGVIRPTFPAILPDFSHSFCLDINRCSAPGSIHRITDVKNTLSINSSIIPASTPPSGLSCVSMSASFKPPPSCQGLMPAARYYIRHAQALGDGAICNQSGMDIYACKQIRILNRCAYPLRSKGKAKRQCGVGQCIARSHRNRPGHVCDAIVNDAIHDISGA